MTWGCDYRKVNGLKDKGIMKFTKEETSYLINAIVDHTNPWFDQLILFGKMGNQLGKLPEGAIEQVERIVVDLDFGLVILQQLWSSIPDDDDKNQALIVNEYNRQYLRQWKKILENAPKAQEYPVKVILRDLETQASGR